MVSGFKLLDDAMRMPAPATPLWSIVDIRFAHLHDWPLQVMLEREASQLLLTFHDVLSFRANDHTAIANYWIVRSEEQVAVGSIYQIGTSTYLDEFSQSTSALGGLQIIHYLIAGYDLCVEVLAIRPPEIVVNVSR
ncbi:hypothetical protein ASF26_02170 [Methylobacterium sp. Leaf93]|nr:hypothetical protein ASF26_02170 [Methylobacterium sp. Leaf93]